MGGGGAGRGAPWRGVEKENVALRSVSGLRVLTSLEFNNTHVIIVEALAQRKHFLWKTSARPPP